MSENRMARLDNWVLEVLFPTRCIICRKPMEPESIRICSHCRRVLPYAKRGEITGHLFSGCSAAFHYQEPLRNAILRYKFQGRQSYGKTFGHFVAEAVAWDLEGAALVTWAPLSKKRLRKRGYDQAKLLAQAAAEELGLPLAPTLEKVRNTKVQSRLRRADQRKANVKDAYRPLKGLDLTGQRVLLIDDICTTGATLDSCTKALLEAGAVDVTCGVLARGGDKD